MRKASAELSRVTLLSPTNRVEAPLVVRSTPIITADTSKYKYKSHLIFDAFRFRIDSCGIHSLFKRVHLSKVGQSRNKPWEKLYKPVVSGVSGRPIALDLCADAINLLQAFAINKGPGSVMLMNRNSDEILKRKSQSRTQTQDRG